MFRNDAEVPSFPDDVILVVGGTAAPLGNRAKEQARMLEPAPVEAQAEFVRDISFADTIPKVMAALQKLADKDYNIVGTRQYVYRSAALITAWSNGVDAYSLTIFPRTGGLRAAIFAAQTAQNMSKVVP